MRSSTNSRCHRWRNQKLSDTNNIAIKYPTQMASPKKKKENHYQAIWGKKVHLTRFVYPKNISRFFRKSVYYKSMNYFGTDISNLYDIVSTPVVGIRNTMKVHWRLFARRLLFIVTRQRCKYHQKSR